jgi:hypothetical protein
VERRYHDGTNVLETTFTTSAGVLVLTDALVAPEEGEHPDHEFIRLVHCEDGRVDIGMVFRPRYDYGLTVPRYEPRGERMGIAYGGADGLALCSDLELAPLGDCTVEAAATMQAGDEAFFSVMLRSSRLRRRRCPRRSAASGIGTTGMRGYATPR